MVRVRTIEPWSDVEDEDCGEGSTGVAVSIALLTVLIGLVVAGTILGVAWLFHIGSAQDL